MEPYYQDLIPAGQEDHPALADPELRAILADLRPERLPRIAALAAEAAGDDGRAGSGPPPHRRPDYARVTLGDPLTRWAMGK